VAATAGQIPAGAVYLAGFRRPLTGRAHPAPSEEGTMSYNNFGQQAARQASQAAQQAAQQAQQSASRASWQAAQRQNQNQWQNGMMWRQQTSYHRGTHRAGGFVAFLVTLALLAIAGYLAWHVVVPSLIR
jgi:Flp pilus assembly protein TadB